MGKTNKVAYEFMKGENRSLTDRIAELKAENAKLRDSNYEYLRLLKEAVRHSEDLAPGMVLEYLGHDIRAAIDDAKVEA